ncbi:hypothetical protein CSOJ01_11069 [Colletotrichum sojae]|uniref:Uncharacterized protein n=1 Tax=Colletotrichum sojae TaxID=2175907 RepID=A0A8H6IYG9_9PEZI|nr:hypothetical protein CSOJ01_11069 [Colletotrichum sojae]
MSGRPLTRKYPPSRDVAHLHLHLPARKGQGVLSVLKSGPRPWPTSPWDEKPALQGPEYYYSRLKGQRQGHRATHDGRLSREPGASPTSPPTQPAAPPSEERRLGSRPDHQRRPASKINLGGTGPLPATAPAPRYHPHAPHGAGSSQASRRAGGFEGFAQKSKGALPAGSVRTLASREEKRGKPRRNVKRSGGSRVLGDVGVTTIRARRRSHVHYPRARVPSDLTASAI